MALFLAAWGSGSSPAPSRRRPFCHGRRSCGRRLVGPDQNDGFGQRSSKHAQPTKRSRQWHHILLYIIHMREHMMALFWSRNTCVCVCVCHHVFIHSAFFCQVEWNYEDSITFKTQVCLPCFCVYVHLFYFLFCSFAATTFINLVTAPMHHLSNNCFWRAVFFSVAWSSFFFRCWEYLEMA